MALFPTDDAVNRGVRTTDRSDRSIAGVHPVTLLGVGVLALAGAVTWLSRSRDEAPSADAGHDSDGTADAPSGPSIDSAADPDEDYELRDGADDDAISSSGPAEGSFVGEERSTAELEARAEEDVEDEPAEPGEMNVDDDIVEELVDEDED